ncbi:MAG TPA: hypothetical protein VGR03_17075 [Candidatus Acidoferrum sp.]|nr:hypothetical protein [Candidatus Acidoferrum sp.]
MNTTVASPNFTPDPVAVPPKSTSPRCPYLYPNGKRCSLPGSQVHSGSCLRHGQPNAPTAIPVPVQNDSEDLSPELLPELSEFESAIDINKFLARLLVLVTKGRISPRRASVLGYITNQLLHSHRAIDRENFLQLEDAGPPRVEIGDIPRPARSQPNRNAGPTIIWDVPGVSIDREKTPS